MIAVWGANGFIGHHLVSVLKQHEIEAKLFARNFDQFPYQSCSLFQTYEFDFSHPQNYMDHLMDCRSVVLMVTASYVRNFEGTPEDEIAMNVDPYKNFIDAIPKDSQFERIIYLSSGGAIYGDVDKHEPISEEHPINPLSTYGKSKLEIEAYIKTKSSSAKWDYTILRLSNPIGVDGKSRGLVNAVLKACKEETAVTVYGDGSIVRDYFDVREIGSCIMLSEDQDVARKKIYNVGSGRSSTIMEVIETAQKVSGKTLQIEYRDNNPADVEYNVLNCRKINNDLNWHATRDLEETMREMWKKM